MLDVGKLPVGVIPQDFANYLAKVDLSIVERVPENSDGRSQVQHGEFDWSIIPCAKGQVEASFDSLKYVENYVDGLLKECYFLTDTSYDTFKIGPNLTFYPDGQLASYEHWSMCGVADNDISAFLHFDRSGRYAEYSQIRQPLQDSWRAVTERFKEKAKQKKKVKRKEVQKTYRKLCSLSRVKRKLSLRR